MPLTFSAYSLLERLGGKPRELYTFAQGEKMWRYTSANKALTVVYGAHSVDYTPALITRGRYQRSQDTGSLKVHVRLARTVPVAETMQENRMFPMAVGIHRHQIGALPVLIAYGDVAAVSQNEGWVEFDLLTGDAAFNQPFPRITLENICQWEFTSANCGVDINAIKHDTTIISVDRSKVLVNDIEESPPGTPRPDGWYDGGRLIIGREQVFVEKQIANEFHIFGGVPTGTLVGDPVQLIPGCDKSLATCKDKYDNVDRFMGFPYLPTTDPMITGLNY